MDHVDEGIRSGKLLKRHIQRVASSIPEVSSDLAVSYFFFVKCLTSLKAVRVLWSERLFQDAVIVARSIFEAHLQYLYIRTDPVRLTQKYLDRELAARREFSVGIIRSSTARNGATWGRKKWVVAAQFYGSASRQTPHNANDSQGWSGKSLREIARLLDRKRSRGRKGEGFWSDYEFFYRLASAVTHTGAMSIQEYMKQPLLTRYRQLSSHRRYFREIPALACIWSLDIGRWCARSHLKAVRDYDLARVTIDTEHFLLSVERSIRA